MQRSETHYRSHPTPNYIRAAVPGGSFFFTVLRQAFREERRARPFGVDAIVVLPDHLHCLWTLPPDDGDFSSRWRRIKAAFSSGLPKGERRSASRVGKGERGIWQRRFWEHCVRDEWDFAAHVDYIHFNPVKHGLVSRVADWPYSSFHRYVEQGRLPLDWGLVAAADVAAGE